MSVLDDFVSIRLYRKQAAEFQWLADNASAPSVQRRYRSIARHYSDLAEREEQAGKTRMAARLEQLRQKRQETSVQVPGTGASRPPRERQSHDWPVEADADLRKGPT